MNIILKKLNVTIYFLFIIYIYFFVLVGFQGFHTECAYYFLLTAPFPFNRRKKETIMLYTNNTQK